MWSNGKRDFISSGNGYTNDVYDFINNLVPESFGFAARNDVVFVIKYVDRPYLTREQPFRQDFLNTAKEIELE